MIITSIDFETANHSNASICAAGMAVFEDGELTEAPYWLLRPPKGYISVAASAAPCSRPEPAPLQRRRSTTPALQATTNRTQSSVELFLRLVSDFGM